MQEHSNTQRTPYLYTGKELDEETGLYYYGARYYDPRTSVWQSADPILGEYLPTDNKERNAQLPGMGGIFHPINLALYTYAHGNPLIFIDPDGNVSFLVSRPLDKTNKANHNFIVTNAAKPGDKDATIYSYGNAGDGTMGLVDKNTEGFSSTTSATDRKAWQSLARSRAGSDDSVTYRIINAPDAKVDELAKKVENGHEYRWVPEVQGGTNSNTAAGAVARAADGGTPYVKNGTPQPGSLVTDRIRFEPRAEQNWDQISDIVAP